MQYATLNDLIDFLKYGTNLNIGVLFFGSYGNKKLKLPRAKSIHSSQICDYQKKQLNGFRRCVYCRNRAIRKALNQKEPFGGVCINGLYEYTKPVLVDNKVVCIIFVGNIVPDGNNSDRLRRSLAKEPNLIDTAEKNFDIQKCETVTRIIESYIKTIFLLFPDSDDDKEYDPLIENIKSFVESNLEYKIDLPLLADMFHYNEKYLGRLFKKKTGLSFSEYINKRRIEKGRELLLNSGDSILNISMKIGFNNVTYFDKVFKKYYGVSPSQYRQNNRLN